MSQPLRFVIVGCGSIADTHARALAALPNHAVLVGCCDKLDTRAKSFSARFQVDQISFETALADSEVDVISLCLPSGMHAEYGVRALQAGKHVLIEKPMDVSVPACEKIIAAGRSSGRKLTVISQHRFDPASLRVKDALNRMELGSLFLTEARVPWYRTQEYYDSEGWRGTWDLDGGGCLMNQGIHTVDLLLWMAGPVVSVQALTKNATHTRIEVEGAMTSILTFSNGAIGTLLATTSAYPGFPAHLALYGSLGSAVIEGDELHTLAVQGREIFRGTGSQAHAEQVAMGGTRAATMNAASAPKNTQSSPANWTWGDAHRAQYEDFIEAIRENRPPLVTGEDGLRAVQLINAIYTSARTGESVQIDTSI